MIYRTISRCRLCQSDSLEVVFSLGEQYLATFRKPEDPIPPKVPLNVLRCAQCGLAQLQHEVSPEVLYRQYFYRSGTNATMTAALKEVADHAMASVDLQPGDAVVDIGSNDGTLLSFYPATVRRIGFEPSEVRKDSPPGIDVIPNFFKAGLLESGRAKIVTSCAVFYDVPEPRQFIDDVASILAPGGVWVNQMNYLPAILKNNAYDFISHEHVTMWSLGAFGRAIGEAGLSITDIKYNDLNGGSFRTTCRGRDYAGVSQTVPGDDNQASRDAWQAFDVHVKAETEKIEIFMNHLADEMVIIRGASTRGQIIMEHAGLDRWVALAADRDPRKWGRLIGGSNIRVVAEDYAKSLKPAYFFVNIYSYLKELAQRDRDYLEAGGKYIVPVPNFRVMGKEELL